MIQFVKHMYLFPSEIVYNIFPDLQLMWESMIVLQAKGHVF